MYIYSYINYIYICVHIYGSHIYSGHKPYNSGHSLQRFISTIAFFSCYFYFNRNFLEVLTSVYSEKEKHYLKII